MNNTLDFDIIEDQSHYSDGLALTLYSLDKSFFPTPWSKDSWLKLFEDHERLLITLKIHEKLIGFSLFDISKGDSFAHLLKIVIEPTMRSRGYSKEILSASFGKLSDLGCSKLFLEVEESNLVAQKLYASFGLKSIHLKKDFYGTGRNAVIMTSDL